MTSSGSYEFADDVAGTIGASEMTSNTVELTVMSKDDRWLSVRQQASVL